jgi:predicted GTPase
MFYRWKKVIIKKTEKEDDTVLFKTVIFKNKWGQTLHILEIPVLEKKNSNYFMVQTRLDRFIFKLYNHHQEKSHFSFREYLKNKMSWSDFEEVYRIEPYKNNA